MRFQEWKTICSNCEGRGKVFAWDTTFPHACPTCGEMKVAPINTHVETVMIATDDIPGGMVMQHGGFKNPDGSDMRLYSKSEIRREANKRGWTIGGETPKPNREHE